MKTPVLTLPGLWNSGPQHWQTLWEKKHLQWRRVIQRNWETPHCADWLATLDAAIGQCALPPVLVAHSLGCSLVTRWAKSHSPHKVAGAFLVAPSDVDAPSYPTGTTGFTPMLMAGLPFPSLVVASTNDRYVSRERAAVFAKAWGSELAFIGEAGHINGDAGFGPWPDGERLLLDFCRSVQAHPPAHGP